MEKHNYPFGISFLLVLSWLLLLISLFLTVFEFTVFDRGFDHREMAKYQVASKVGMTEEGINTLFDEMLDYLSGDREELQTTVVVNGESRPAYSEKEILHMIDVRNLFQKGTVIRNSIVVLSAAILIGLFIYVRRNGRSRAVFYQSFGIASGIFLILIGVMAIIVAVDFDHAFIVFHQIFFTNDLWQLSYQTDLLMNIVPERYSNDVIVRAIAAFTMTFAVLNVLALLGYRHSSKKEASVKEASE